MFAKEMPGNSLNVQSPKDVPTTSAKKKEDQQLTAVQGDVTNTA